MCGTGDQCPRPVAVQRCCSCCPWALLRALHEFPLRPLPSQSTSFIALRSLQPLRAGRREREPRSVSGHTELRVSEELHGCREAVTASRFSAGDTGQPVLAMSLPPATCRLEALKPGRSAGEMRLSGPGRGQRGSHSGSELVVTCNRLPPPHRGLKTPPVGYTSSTRRHVSQNRTWKMLIHGKWENI